MRYSRPFFPSMSYMLFILICPGTILYYVAITSSLIPPIAGGYFGTSTAAALAILAPAYFYIRLKIWRIHKTDIYYFSFLLFFALIAFANWVYSSDTAIFTWHLTAIAQCASIFLVCKGVAEASNLPGKLMTLFWVATSICMMSITVGGRFSLREISPDLAEIPSYQTFAMCYFLISFIMVIGTKSTTLRAIINVIAIICLYMNGARSEFVAYILFVCMYEFLSSSSKAMPVLAFLVSLVAAILIFNSGIIELPDSRIASLIDLQNDNSNNERNKISAQGLERIYKNPVMGDYGNYPKGEYMHNILSVWHDLGIAGLIFLTMLIISPMIRLLSASASGVRQNSLVYASFAILVSAATLLLVGKYFTYLMIPAALGFYSSSVIRDKDLHTADTLEGQP
ncbi:O-antigen ligase domain-containing protein [Pseudomonas plecoglossicida]|nr:O-antigen ligase domain-containing protein [Pseudomonas plecoglossicida]